MYAPRHEKPRPEFAKVGLADRSTRRLLNRLARLDVLLIDEFGYLNLKPEQSNTFFKADGRALSSPLHYHHDESGV
jgi:hypothetical protein